MTVNDAAGGPGRVNVGASGSGIRNRNRGGASGSAYDRGGGD